MIGFLHFLHVRFAVALIVLAAIIGLWGAYQFLRYRGVSGGFRSLFLLTAGLTALQGLAGLGIYLLGQQPRRGILHVVYGIFAVVFLPGVFTYASRGGREREAAFLGAAGWIVLVAYLRGWATGQ